MGATAKGLDGVIRLAQERAARARNLAPALRVAAEAVKTGIDDSFRSSQDFSGAPFAPNKPSTVKRKGSSKPLINTGALRSSISVAVVGNNTIRFGTITPYAAPVISGFMRSTTRVPGRNPFPVSPLGRWLGSQRASALLNKVGRIVSDYIQRGRL